MYNETQKQDFIKEIYSNLPPNRVSPLKIFDEFEQFESAWGADLSTQSARVVQPALDHIVRGKSEKRGAWVLKVIKEYISWCQSKGLDINYNLISLKINTIDQMRESMVGNPRDLLEVLNHRDDDYITNAPGGKRGFDMPDKETIDITYRVFLWMAYSGLREEEAILVTSNDIDFTSMQIYYNGFKFPIYSDAREDFQKACDLTEFLYEHTAYICKRPRADGNIIMRGFKTPIPNLKTILPEITKRLRHDGYRKLSFERIHFSGLFYREYEKEIAGLPIDFKEALEIEIFRRKQRILSQNGVVTEDDIKQLKTDKRNLLHSYKMRYEKWKFAIHRL